MNLAGYSRARKNRRKTDLTFRILSLLCVLAVCLFAKSCIMAYRPIATINVRANEYQPLVNFANVVVAGMTGNPDFPTPSPTLVAITAAAVTVQTDINLWGPQGNRGTHAQVMALRAAAILLRNLLLQEMAYVQNTAYIAGGNDYAAIAAIIVTSGYGVKNAPTPQGLLAAPQNVHQTFSPFISIYTPRIKWKKPIGLHSPNNVKFYTLLRGATNDPNAANEIGTSTRTSFIDNTAAAATQYYYFVVGNNTAGRGTVSADLFVSTPA